MAPARLKAHQQQLLRMRMRLRGEVSQMASLTLAGDGEAAHRSRMPIHTADVAGDHFEREISLALASSKEDLLEQIENALERIELGEYGICQECERRIPKARLDAVPYAALCVQCARQNEVPRWRRK